VEIILPPCNSFVEGIRDGSIAVLRAPCGNVKTGDVITAKTSGVDFEQITLRVKNVQYPLLFEITDEEARQEGYSAPDFCPLKTICENIEFRLDLESLLFDQSGTAPELRSRAGIERELLERVKSGCSSCLVKKQEKDMFLLYWRKAYQDIENRKIMKIAFEVVMEN
jgi:hypothetical protein